jgi:PAS domain S-box-containing protein
MNDDVLFEAYKAFPHIAVVSRLIDGTIVEVNESFERSTGYTREEIVGTTTLRLYEHPEQRTRLVEAVNRYGYVHDFEFRGVTKSGEIRHCQLHAQKISINGDAHLFSVIQDITEIRDLQRKILSYADDERRQLASELHDGLAQDLAGVSYLMRSLEQTLEGAPSAQLDQIRQLRDVIEKSIDKARALARGFSPIEMSQGGLAVALYRLRLDVATIYQIEMSVDFHSSIQLNETSSSGVYAIIHEAVLNAAKHADCKYIAVALEPCNGELDVSVIDDGNGIVEGAGQHGMGIRLMQHRAAVLGGHLHIETKAGQGTRVSCRFDVGAQPDRPPTAGIHLI